MQADGEKKRNEPGHSEGRNPVDKKESVKNKQIIAHIIPYSKASGFKKNFDDYYSGTNSMAQRGFVKMILNGIVDELTADRNKTFTFSEIKYLQMWYVRAKDEMKEKLQKLIENGQFEVATGGWTSTDEACPNYEDLINNVMIGHQFLQKEFGVTPSIGWNLDAAGHSATNARLFAQLGFDAQFFSNIDEELKKKLSEEANQRLNFVWQPYSQHDNYQIFTGVLRDGKNYPHGIYSDSGPDVDFTPFINDPSRTDFNAPDRSQQFINYIHELAASYKEQNILIPMGTDFAYQNAGQNFKQIEEIIDWINKNKNDTNIEFVMSTPSKYVKAIKEEKQKYFVYYDDLMPYQKISKEGYNEFWTGYYSSKPAFKKQVKDASSLLHAHNTVFAQKVLRQNVSESEVAEILKAKDDLMDALGVVNDQSAIAGGQRELVQAD